jgi:hypothetical protein
VEGLTVTKEIRDRDQQVLEQRAGLTRVSAQVVQVVPEVVQAIDLHASGDPTNDRRAFVIRKIAARACAQEAEDLAQGLLACIGGDLWQERGVRPCFGGHMQPMFTPEIVEQAARHLLDGQHPIDHAGADRGLGHPGMLRFRWLLRDGEPPSLLDALDPERAVAITAGQDDRDRVGPMCICEGSEEEVHRHVPAALARQVPEPQAFAHDPEVLGGWNHVHVVSLEQLGVMSLRDRHARRALQKRIEVAFMPR